MEAAQSGSEDHGRRNGRLRPMASVKMQTSARSMTGFV